MTLTRKGGAALNSNSNSNSNKKSGKSKSKTGKSKSKSRSKSPQYKKTAQDITIFIDGTEVGKLEYSIHFGVFVIDLIMINPEHRGKNLGKTVLRMALEIAFKERGVNQVQLQNETQSNKYNPNKIPNRMYERAGFIEMDPGNDYMGHEMVLTKNMYDRITLQNGYLY